jgi:hypothetical protein
MAVYSRKLKGKSTGNDELMDGKTRAIFAEWEALPGVQEAKKRMETATWQPSQV